MKVTKQELQDFGLYDSLPQTLKEMTDGDYFVFYYKVDEENVKLEVFETQIVKQVNLSLYRGMSSKKADKVGFSQIHLKLEMACFINS